MVQTFTSEKVSLPWIRSVKQIQQLTRMTTYLKSQIELVEWYEGHSHDDLALVLFLILDLLGRDLLVPDLDDEVVILAPADKLLVQRDGNVVREAEGGIRTRPHDVALDDVLRAEKVAGDAKVLRPVGV